jgi:HSP20 family protein
LSEKKMKKTEAASEKKMIMPAKPKKRPSSMIEPVRASNLWTEFDKAFDRFRRDFESALWPHERALGHRLPSLAEMETTIPYIDLEDKGDSFVLSAEAPGFKKDEIDINICGNSVEISGCKEMTTDEKNKSYIRKERMSESFYRTLTLPEEIKYEEVSADLKDGVLEIVLPKKNPKQRKKIQIK